MQMVRTITNNKGKLLTIVIWPHLYSQTDDVRDLWKQIKGDLLNQIDISYFLYYPKSVGVATGHIM